MWKIVVNLSFVASLNENKNSKYSTVIVVGIRVCLVNNEISFWCFITTLMLQPE